MTGTAKHHSQFNHTRWRALAKFCASALLLMLPGTCVVVAALWMYRRCVAAGARAARPGQKYFLFNY
jgi:hypothetical protein